MESGEVGWAHAGNSHEAVFWNNGEGPANATVDAPIGLPVKASRIFVSSVKM